MYPYFFIFFFTFIITNFTGGTSMFFKSRKQKEAEKALEKLREERKRYDKDIEEAQKKISICFVIQKILTDTKIKDPFFDNMKSNVFPRPDTIRQGCTTYDIDKPEIHIADENNVMLSCIKESIEALVHECRIREYSLELENEVLHLILKTLNEAITPAVEKLNAESIKYKGEVKDLKSLRERIDTEIQKCLVQK